MQTLSQIGSIIKRFSTLPGEHCIDGYLFLKYFNTLHDKTWKDLAKKQVIQKKKKERILRMGQHTDILPKLLGR
jgi:hypothetical protein